MVYRVSCSSALCPKLLIIAHVTPWVHFRRNQSVNLRNTVSEVQKTPFLDSLSDFLQLGVVLETSNIAHVTPRVHTFLGKKRNFSNRLRTFFIWIHIHTYKHTYTSFPARLRRVFLNVHILVY